jgi:hypothetical protein
MPISLGRFLLSGEFTFAFNEQEVAVPGFPTIEKKKNQCPKTIISPSLFCDESDGTRPSYFSVPGTRVVVPRQNFFFH